MSTAEARTKKKILVLLSHAPYSGGLAKDGLDYCLAAAAFEQDITLLFTGDGVLQLIEKQDPHNIQQKNITKTLSALPIYGIEQFYVDAQSLADYGLAPSNLTLNVESVNGLDIAKLTSDADVIMSF